MASDAVMGPTLVKIQTRWKETRARDVAGNEETAARMYAHMVSVIDAELEPLKDGNHAKSLQWTTRQTSQIRKAAVERAAELEKFVEAAAAAAAAAAADAAARARQKTVAVGGTAAQAENSTASSTIRGKFEEAATRRRVAWDDVVGMEETKTVLREAVSGPTMFPRIFTQGFEPWTGVLMYGPPGTGKTQLAMAVASQTRCTFVSITSAEIVDKWQGESEKLVKELFAQARLKAPCVIFIDEVDAIGGARGGDNASESMTRLKTQLMSEMNDLRGVVVVGATNFPWVLDSAILRRFQHRLYVPLPDFAGRRQIARLKMEGAVHTLSAADFETIAKRTEGFSGDDITNLVKRARNQTYREMTSARWFSRTRDNLGWEAVPRDPACFACPMLLSTTTSPLAEISFENRTCTTCGCVRADGMELADEVRLRAVTMEDFVQALVKIKPSVDAATVKEYEKWTEEKGTVGS